MDGVLLKWTNYLSGWQPRYFVLEGGILSYYQSKADINNSCKGSIKVSACDINAHPTDHTRLDIVIPGEAYYYVRASNQQERQLWLVALGTCKAQSYDMTLRLPNTPLAIKESESPTGKELLRVKRSELVMYRDLLTQQLYNIKMSLKTDQPPNVENMNEASALVNATCESFINTLEDCMQLVDLNSYMKSRESSLSPTSKSKSFFSQGSSWGFQPMTRQVSIYERKVNPSRPGSDDKDSSFRPSLNHSISLSEQEDSSHSSTPNVSGSIQPAAPSKPSAVPSSNSSNANNSSSEVVDLSTINGHSNLQVALDATPEERVPTFFSQMTTSFLDLKLTHDMEVPTVQFLDACRSLVSIFDKLNEQAFIIGKLDIAGNIRKIHQKYSSSPESFSTLHRMVAVEIKKKEAEDTNSATVALLWLCKSLEFTHELMLRLLGYDCDLEAAEMKQIISEVYEKVLKAYHCWVVRSAFYMILPSMPALSRLIASLAVCPRHLENPNFRLSLKCDIDDYLTSLRSVLCLLQTFFDANGLKIKAAAD